MPEVAPDITADELDKEVLEELRSLPGDLADLVGRHLVAAERALEDDDPGRAHEHTKVARRFAARIGVVREAAGIVAYRAGHFSEALSDLRAARRMTGSDAYLPVMADCERGLGRPERAIDLVRSREAERLDRAGHIELTIVESGARRDLGQHDAAVITLQRLPELRNPQPKPWSARLAFAYADALADAGHQEAATDWFGRAMAFDEDGETDAAERYAELTGAVIEDVEEDFDLEDDTASEAEDYGQQDEDVEGEADAEAEVDAEAADDTASVADAEDLADEPGAKPARGGSPTDSDTHARASGDAGTSPEADASTGTNTSPDSDTSAETGTSSDADADIEADADAEGEADVEGEAADHAETEDDVEAEAGAGAEAEEDSSTDVDAEEDSSVDVNAEEEDGARIDAGGDPSQAPHTAAAGTSKAPADLPDARGDKRNAAAEHPEAPSITPAFIEPDFGDALDEPEAVTKNKPKSDG